MDERKSAAIELKADEDGAFRAVFSTFDVVDRDGDVTSPGAFQDGAPVRISSWGHNWGALPVGRGVIGSDENQAWVDGQFFLDTEAGSETYRTVKNLGELQEWSYGFRVLESRESDDGKVARILDSVEVFEVSPVMVGAGVDTRTESIKAKQTFEQESESALAAGRAFVDRAKSLADLRAKDGRVLSGVNRERLKRHLETLSEITSDIEELLSATEPGKAADVDPVVEFVRWQAFRSRELGVAI